MCLDAKPQPSVLSVVTSRHRVILLSWMSCRLPRHPKKPSLQILRRLSLRCKAAGHLCFLSVSLLSCSCSTQFLDHSHLELWSYALSCIAICRPKKKGIRARSDGKIPFKKADKVVTSPAPPDVRHNLTRCKILLHPHATGNFALHQISGQCMLTLFSSVLLIVVPCLLSGAVA